MIVWHVETSSGARFEWARDAEHQRQQMIDYFNECLADGDELPDDATFEDAKDAIEEHENFSEEEVYGGYLIESRERDTILAALRLWQHALDGNVLLTNVICGGDTLEELRSEIACGDHGTPLTPDEIDALCERINA